MRAPHVHVHSYVASHPRAADDATAGHRIAAVLAPKATWLLHAAVYVIVRSERWTAVHVSVCADITAFIGMLLCLLSRHKESKPEANILDTAILATLFAYESIHQVSTIHRCRYKRYISY